MQNVIQFFNIKEAYIKFIRDTLENEQGINSLKEWVDKNLNTPDTKIEKKLAIAFFAAEKEIYTTYLYNHEIAKVKKLSEVFNNITDSQLQKVELQIIYNSISATIDKISAEEKSVLLNDVIKPNFAYSNTNSDNNISEMWQNTCKLLGEDLDN